MAYRTEAEVVKNYLQALAGKQKADDELDKAKFQVRKFMEEKGAEELIDDAEIFKIIKSLTLKSGIKKTVSPHTLRHSFATHLVEGGADLRAVQEMLGHESITTTEVYTHLDRSYLRQTILDHHPLERK